MHCGWSPLSRSPRLGATLMQRCSAGATSAMGHTGIEQKISASAPIGDSQQNSVTQSPRWQERELPAAISERLHSSVLEAPLVSSHSARGATESLCHIILVSQALLNQSDHRIGFAHMVS